MRIEIVCSPEACEVCGGSASRRSYRPPTEEAAEVCRIPLAYRVTDEEGEYLSCPSCLGRGAGAERAA